MPNKRNITQDDRENFVDVVKQAFKEGYFQITDGDNYGCIGLHCETPNNGFYCLPPDAEDWEGTPEEYVEHEGVDGICQDIANTVLNMFEEELEEQNLGEGYLYILELNDLFHSKVLKKFIDIAHTIVAE